jgi:uncharacterized membrane protein YdjX (TVP38/TMEM64 family)
VEKNLRPRPWRLAAIGLVLVVVVAAFWLNREAVERWVKLVVAACREAGPWAYFGAMAILPIFGFSLFAFVVSAGPVFAPMLGVSHVIAYGVLALAVNVTLSYILARWAFRPFARRLVEWLGYTLPDSPAGAGWEIGLIARLIPGPPFGLQSCLLGLAKLPFGPYLATSLFVPSLYLAATVLLESGLQGRNAGVAAIAGIFLVATAAACHRLRRRFIPRAPLAAASLPNQG